MSLTSFRVSDQKSIVLAEATNVPPVMVIAGPNGVGKSTLLYAIKNGAGVTTPNTRIFYQPPHRALRRTHVQRRHLMGGMRPFQDILSGGDVGGFEGLNFQDSSRTPENIDEAGSTIKHIFGKIENRRQAILSGVVDRTIASGDTTLDLQGLPAVYEPLFKLTEYLLPHLTFSRIDFSDENNIRFLWKKSDARGDTEIDIDTLSSGEKSIIILFLSLLENQIKDRLDLLERVANQTPAPEAEVVGDRVLLIDEPEQHLHPDLQAKILSYMRNLTLESNVQFVITTHSPTLLDQAFDSELFALSPPSTDATENQLRRIATNIDRLETLKQLAGGAYFLTTGRVIICIEGESPSDTKEPTDIALLEIMYPRATAFTLVPTKGKGNVINTVERLREFVPEQTFKIRVRGLVDPDQSAATVAGVETLPVCMIENLLLDPDALFAYLSAIGATTFTDTAAVEAELKAIALTLINEEVRLRIARHIKPVTVRINGSTVADIKTAKDTALADIQGMVPADAELEALVASTLTQVNAIVADQNELKLFHGKNILKEFYQRHVSPRNIGYKEACLGIGKQVSVLNKVGPILDPVFDRLSE